MGGESSFASIKDMTQKAELNLDPAAGGLKVSETEFWLAPDIYRDENALPFGKVVTYFDGQTGWAASPQGVTDLPAEERKQMDLELFRNWPRLLASAQDSNRQIKDEENGTLRISDKAGNSVVLTIDPATGLPMSQSYAEGGPSGQDVLETYADWQDTNGVKLPHKITITQNGKHFADVKVVSIAINQGLTAEQLSKKP